MALNRARKKDYRWTREQYQQLQQLKTALLDEGNNRAYRDHEKTLLGSAAHHRDVAEFPQNLASAALTYRRLSEKQAFIIAGALVEAGIIDLKRYAEGYSLSPSAPPLAPSPVPKNADR